jgi:hypothetical protein
MPILKAFVREDRYRDLAAVSIPCTAKWCADWLPRETTSATTPSAAAFSAGSSVGCAATRTKSALHVPVDQLLPAALRKTLIAVRMSQTKPKPRATDTAVHGARDPRRPRACSKALLNSRTPSNANNHPLAALSQKTS